MPANAALLVARLLLAFLFLSSGFSVLGDIAGTAAYFSSLGFPAPTLVAWATCLFEIVAGALVLIGLQTRVAALLLAAFCVAAAFIGHYGQGGGDRSIVSLELYVYKLHMQAYK